MKKPFALVALIVALLLAGMGGLTWWWISTHGPLDTRQELAYLDLRFENVLDDENFDFRNYAYVFPNYTDYLAKFGIKSSIHTNKITVEDFANYTVALITIQYDSCSETDVQATGYTIKDNLLTVDVEYRQECGVCAPYYMYYVAKLDKSITKPRVEFNNRRLSSKTCSGMTYDKPMMYFYPETTTELSVTLGRPELLTTSYPYYNNGWQVTASPDGMLVDASGRSYYGLYWEGCNHQAKVAADGFVVKGSDTANFLEEKLAILGLTEREANEFIVYWLPQMEHNAYNYIRFETNEEIDTYMPLTIVPTPNSVVRVAMDYLPLNALIEVTEQVLTTPERKGFTVVEWGGSLIEE